MGELEAANTIVVTEMESYMEWYGQLCIVPTIVKLQKTFDDVRISELEKVRRKKMKHLSDEDFELVKELTYKIMKKTLHKPIVSIKKYHSSMREENHGDEVAERRKFIEEIF